MFSLLRHSFFSLLIFSFSFPALSATPPESLPFVNIPLQQESYSPFNLKNISANTGSISAPQHSSSKHYFGNFGDCFLRIEPHDPKPISITLLELDIADICLPQGWTFALVVSSNLIDWKFYLPKAIPNVLFLIPSSSSSKQSGKHNNTVLLVYPITPAGDLSPQRIRINVLFSPSKSKKSSKAKKIEQFKQTFLNTFEKAYTPPPYSLSHSSS